jgi:hypothetical protein
MMLPVPTRRLGFGFGDGAGGGAGGVVEGGTVTGGVETGGADAGAAGPAAGAPEAHAERTMAPAMTARPAMLIRFLVALNMIRSCVLAAIRWCSRRSTVDARYTNEGAEWTGRRRRIR